MCVYEAYSIVTGRTPTISHMVWANPWLGPAALVGLALHFYWEPLLRSNT